MLIGCALLTVPLAASTYPFLTDYLLHMGRAAILLRMGTPLDHHFYQAHWEPLPNLAFDAIVPLLARMMPLNLAGKVFVGMSAILQATGACALVCAIQRRRTPVALLPFLLTYNMAFEWGFLAYLFTLGLGIWGAAIWVWTRGANWRSRLPFLALPALLFLGHLAALGVYIVLVGCVELAHWSREHHLVQRNLSQLAASLVPAAALHFGFQAVSRSHGTEWGDVKTRVVDLLISPGMDLSRHAGELMGYVVFCTIALLIALKYVRVNRIGLYALAGIGACYVIVPEMTLGSAFASMRLLGPLLLVLPACLEIRKWKPVTVAIGVMTLATLYVGQTAWRWHEWNESNQELDAIASRVPAGSMLMDAEAERDPWTPPRMWHGEEALLMKQDLFLPTTILEPGQQPVSFSPREEALHNEIMEAMDEKVSGRALPLTLMRRRFDSLVLGLDSEYRSSHGAGASSFLLVRQPGAPLKLAPEILRPVFRGEWYSLYEVAGARFDSKGKVAKASAYLSPVPVLNNTVLSTSRTQPSANSRL